MGEKTLFLAWQDNGVSRQWFPIGRLDADVECEKYRFRYVGGAKRAKNEFGFPLLVPFPSLEKDYRSSKLFSLFNNRVMQPNRPDFKDYIQSIALSEDSDPIDMLAVSGGNRVTDAYEIFPKLLKNADGGFACRFFVHGIKFMTQAAQERLELLKAHEELCLALELTNPLNEYGLQVQTADYHMIGWAPRYMARDLALAMTGPLGSCRARVVRLNPMATRSHRRLLIEMSGNLGDHEPMSGPDFQPLVPD